MSVLRADYFDGKTSVKHEVSMLLAGGKLKLVGRDVSAEFDARKVRVAPRLADTPRWLYLPGGGACALADNDAVDRFARERRFPRLLHRLESRPFFAALAVALVVSGLWLLVDRALPVAVERVADKIPPGAESVLGEQTLAAMDQSWLQPSKLPQARQDALRRKFAELARAAGEAPAPRVEFRASPAIGPNAFALPAGLIVVTDELVRLAQNDEQVLAVLAHELGHVRYRHTMRHLLQGSATALIIAGVTGDIASTTSLAASAPAVLLQTKYSRDYEREADRFAIDLLQKSGIGPRHFAAILARFEARAKGKKGFVPTFLASHPPTEERKALALAEAGASAQEEEEEQYADERVAQARPERPPLAIVDPEQQKIAALLEKRDFAELERVLAGSQLEFEKDPKSALPLERAFRAFQKLPRSSDAALSEWVRASPSSYVARLARGAFYLSQGLEARGTKYRKETPKEDLRTMEAYFEKSSADLERSLQLSQKPYLSRRCLMTIALYGSRSEMRTQYQEALKLAPGSIETRLAYMRSLEPRWGGSYAEMEAFVAESRKALEPKVANRLAARIQAYRGFESSNGKDFGKALEYLDQAIALDEDAEVLCQRSYVFGQLNRDKEAFADVGRALSKTPDDRYCMERSIYLAARVDDAAEVIRVMSLVIEVNPNSGPAHSRRGWGYQRLEKPELAFVDYLAAAELGDAWAQTQVGKFYWGGIGVKQNREEALVWLEKAAKQGEASAATSLAEARKALGRPPQ